MALDKGTCLRYYKRKDIQEAIVEHAGNKEIGIRYGESFGKRPDILTYPKEVLELALKGATSFHCSEELWDNPLDLSGTTGKKELDGLRKGWDLVLDIDCKFIDYSKICADLIVKFLKKCEVKDVSCKFSVTGDTPILIECENKVQLIPIKQATELYKVKNKCKILSLDKNNLICFSNIKDYLIHQENVFEISYENSAFPIRATGYHSVFVWEKGDIIQKEVKLLNESDYLVTFKNASKLERKVPVFEWEFDFFKKKVKSQITVTPRLMLLLGYYLAEGHITKCIHQIGFSFNVNEKGYIQEVIDLLEEFTHRKISVRHPNPNSTQILIHSKEWYVFFEQTCGKGASHKHLPYFVWTLPKEYSERLLEGYLRGDGYQKGEYSITAKSVSHQLIRELVWLCKMNNISCSLNHEFNKEHFMPQGNLFKGSHAYMINIPKSELQSMAFFRGRNKFSPNPKGKTYPVDGLLKVYNQIKPKLFNKHRAEQMTLRKEFANLDRINRVLKWFKTCGSVGINEECKLVIHRYESLFMNDIMLLRIKKITLKQDKEEVYDFSVEKTERFFGGEYPVLLHNSGNKGFHIGVPFESFPSQISTIPTKLLFPEAAKKIAAYVKENIKEELGKRILAFENNDFGKVKEKVGLEAGEIIGYEKNSYGDKVAKLSVDKFLEIDTVLISSRHLYRMPYSLHEKSGLVSLPIDPDKVMEFQREMAHPDKILMPMFTFLNRQVDGNSARLLLTRALDFEAEMVQVKEEKERVLKEKREEEFKVTSPIREEFFPPCMKLMLNGMEDGKKRAVFCFSGFLGKLGWNKAEIEEYLHIWNKEKNQAPLRENYLQGQLHSFNPGEKLPPNCDNESYYKGLGVCHPDSLCVHIKNPVNYAILRWKDRLKQNEEEEKAQKKELRRKAREEKEKEKGEKIREEREKEKTEKIREEKAKVGGEKNGDEAI